MIVEHDLALARRRLAEALSPQTESIYIYYIYIYTYLLSLYTYIYIYRYVAHIYYHYCYYHYTLTSDGETDGQTDDTRSPNFKRRIKHDVDR